MIGEIIEHFPAYKNVCLNLIKCRYLALSDVLELSGLDSLLELEQTLAGQGGLPAGGPLSNRLFVSGF